MTKEEIAEYLEAFRLLLADGIKAPVRMVFRAAPRRLVPASEWETIETELHSIGDLGEELVWLYTQAHNTPRSQNVNLSAFPSPKIEYGEVQVLPFRNAAVLLQKRLRDEQPETEQATNNQPTQPRITDHSHNATMANLTPDKIGESLRGEKQKETLCAHLKVPVDMASEDRWLSAAWYVKGIVTKQFDVDAAVADYLAAQQQAHRAHNINIINAGKRMMYEQSVRRFPALLGIMAEGGPSNKTEWTPFLLAISEVAGWFVFARRSAQAQDKFLFRAQKMIKDGFVDCVALFDETMMPSFSDVEQPQQRFRGGRGTFRGRGGRFNPHQYHQNQQPMQTQQQQQQQQQQPQNGKK